MRSRVRGLLAGTTFEQLGTTFDEAFRLLGEVPARELREWEADLLRSDGTRVVFGSREVTVLETTTKNSNTRRRSLHFNDRLDLQQSLCAIDRATGKVRHDRPPPGELQGLSLAVAMHRHSILAGEASDFPLRVCVLGAGGCTIPSFLHQSFSPHCEVDCVELSPAVRKAARQCFGVAQLEKEGKDDGGPHFRLHGGCAVEWLRGATTDGFDVIIVDVEAGGSSTTTTDWADLVAPPAEMLAGPFLAEVDRALAKNGAFAVNVIGGPSAHEASWKALTSGLSPSGGGGDSDFSFARCVAPVPNNDGAANGGRQRIMFAARGCATPPTSAAMKAALDGLLPRPLVDSPDAWLQSWTHE